MNSEASPIMKQAAKAAALVATWSPSKQAYAERVVNASK